MYETSYICISEKMLIEYLYSTYQITRVNFKDFSKIFRLEYFGCLIVSHCVFFYADSESTHICTIEMQPRGVMGERLPFRWSFDQCLAKREKRLHLSVGLGFEIR